MLRRFAWILSLAVLLPLAACSRDSGTPPSPPDPNTVHYTALGASDAIGFGGSAPCVPFAACPDGTGYVQRLARDLGRGGATVTLVNLGVPGSVLSPAIQEIGNAYGRGIPGNFLQQQAPFVPRTSTLVTIFAGGNDTNAVGTAVDRGVSPTPDAYIDQQVRRFADDYLALVAAIRGRAPTARIVVLNLPNMAGLPYGLAFSTQQRRWLQRISVGFSVQGANALTAQGVTVVDLLCDARSYAASNYSSDGFHPNDAGYAYMEGELRSAVEAGSWPAPRASCPQMTIVP